MTFLDKLDFHITTQHKNLQRAINHFTGVFLDKHTLTKTKTDGILMMSKRTCSFSAREAGGGVFMES